MPVPREVVLQVVQPGGARLGVGEAELRRDLGGDVHEAVLGQDHRRADVLDVVAAEADQQDLRVVVAVALAVLGVELRVARDAEARSLDLVHRLAVLVVRVHGGVEAVERLVELVRRGTAARDGREATDGDGGDGDGTSGASQLDLHLLHLNR